TTSSIPSYARSAWGISTRRSAWRSAPLTASRPTPNIPRRTKRCTGNIFPCRAGIAPPDPARRSFLPAGAPPAYLPTMRARLIVVLLLFVSVTATAELRPPAAAIASAQPSATAAGREILQAGGNAFDAAVAVAAALAVVEPYSSGMGGGGFFLLHRARDGRDVMIDARERAPDAARANMSLDEHGRPIPRASLDGPSAAAIPGLPAGLVHVAQHYGVLPLSRSLAPAVRLARDGF